MKKLSPWHFAYAIRLRRVDQAVEVERSSGSALGMRTASDLLAAFPPVEPIGTSQGPRNIARGFMKCSSLDLRFITKTVMLLRNINSSASAP
jgi:hypothetical protein